MVSAVMVSAKSGRGMERLLDTVVELFDRYTARVPTPELNRVLADLAQVRQPPTKAGKRLNILYGAQIRVRPSSTLVAEVEQLVGHGAVELA